MTPNSEWDRWAERWLAPGVPADLDALIERATRARRGSLRIRMASAAMAIFAVAVIGAALRHAGNAFEVSLGVIVAGAIVTMWVADLVTSRRSIAALDAPEDLYLAARRALCVRRIGFAHFGWIVIALDLVFLIPWWIGGFQVHGYGLHLGQVLTMWSPLALMATFVGWTIWMRRRALDELRQLETKPVDREPNP